MILHIENYNSELGERQTSSLEGYLIFQGKKNMGMFSLERERERREEEEKEEEGGGGGGEEGRRQRGK